MNRSRSRCLRAIAVVAGGAVATLVASSVPALAATGVAGTVSAGWSGLSVRVGPTTSAAKVGKLPTGSRITITCQEKGQRIAGRVRTTDRWDRLVDGRYVSDAYVKRQSSVTLCSSPGAPATGPSAGNPSAAGAWVSPVRSPRLIGGFRTMARPNHDGADLVAARNTPIHAAAAGTVIRVVCNTSGPSCDIDGSRQIKGCGWYLEILHAGDIVTRYCHLVRRPGVHVGQQVSVDEVVGYSGNSGSSSGPHLHFEVHLGRQATHGNAIDPVSYMRQVNAPIN